jgi:hypothetical protein
MINGFEEISPIPRSLGSDNVQQGNVLGDGAMVKFIAGMVLGGILAMYPAIAYPQQLHHALTYIGLGAYLPATTTAATN